MSREDVQKLFQRAQAQGMETSLNLTVKKGYTTSTLIITHHNRNEAISENTQKSYFYNRRRLQRKEKTREGGQVQHQQSQHKQIPEIDAGKQLLTALSVSTLDVPTFPAVGKAKPNLGSSTSVATSTTEATCGGININKIPAMPAELQQQLMGRNLHLACPWLMKKWDNFSKTGKAFCDE